MVLGRRYRTGLDAILRTSMTTLPFLLLALSPFVVFNSDYALILSPLCESNIPFGLFL